MNNYLIAFKSIIYREFLRFLQQYTRFFASLVRPLVWLFIFAAGFRSVLGVSIIPPYETYVLYETYITPGLCAIILLFNGMQNSLAMIYDREMGSMKILLTAPLPRWFLLLSKAVASVSVGVVQVYVFLLVAYFWGVEINFNAYLTTLPTLYLVGLMFNAVGLLLSSLIKQLENFAGVMNFVIFPVFFASSALYPLWNIQQSSLVLYKIAMFNPFTYATEAIRFALYNKFNEQYLGIILLVSTIFVILSFWSYSGKRIKF